jgi:hypothetical protein
MKGFHMTEQRFSSTIEQSGGAVYIALPFDPDQVWGEKDRHHITGTINGCRIRGPLKKTDSGYQLSLGAAWRRDNQLDAGATVNVILAPEGPQLDNLAPDIVAALGAAPPAKAFFEGLATFYRKGYLRWIDGARKPEARAERIAEMIRLLETGQKARK